ncbi:enoyl-CoA delta isomerase 2, peroxisomal-like protein [Cinnamomum micranthum f. kanehirae]|uniref:Enoyl-CoA delta isomerase 2, peroxisomal-like protein n=1 Tax=Cinnamomum micranthum f. kanehirae TaxID=337451 RepID=A0A3S3MJI7_9MAGN|nr:enoyl-CoA delta isomerase 2, peroxisomal-like protein [Cinnamomum micranthum f. kanehirae]
MGLSSSQEGKRVEEDDDEEVVLKARKFTASEAFEYGFADGFYDASAKTVEVAIGEAEKLASSKWKRESYTNLRAGTFPGVIEELDQAQRDPYVWPKGSKL